MLLNLDRLPYDVLFNIAGRLSYSDVIHLTLTCRQLYQLRCESTLCRRVVEDHAPYTQEAKLAVHQQITYREALERIYFRRGSFSTATPNSACVVDYASSLIYRQNVLCYMAEGVVRVRSVLDISDDFKVDTEPMAKWLSATHFGTTDVRPEISLLHYSDWVVSLHFDYSETDLCLDWCDDGHWLIYVELRKFDPMTGAGVSLIRPADGASKLFVRNTAKYLLYGTHTGIGTHGHHEWKIHSVSLADDSPLPPNIPALQLDNLVGSDLGSTVAFEIHDEHFYAVSNQTSFVVEEVDWTSFYHCVRFPLHSPVKDSVQINTRVFRRQHAEGPINDSWTDLGLHVDEKTNKLQIVEARREWLNGGSKQERTFYTHVMTFPPSPSAQRRQTGEQVATPEATDGGGIGTQPSASPTSSASPSASSDATQTNEDTDVATQPSSASTALAPLLPANDVLVGTIGSGNNPHWGPSEKRLPRALHPERKHDEQHLSPAFILARTKHRAYNLSCSAFLDLVEDDACCPAAAAAGGPPCLRLRIGARRKQPFLPLVAAAVAGKGKGRLGEDETVAAADMSAQQQMLLPPDEDRFVYPPIRLWPPPGGGRGSGDDDANGMYDCSGRLHDILNAPLTPPATLLPQTAVTEAAGGVVAGLAGSAYTAPPPATEIVAAADERSVAFLRRPRYGSGERSGPIVLVSFDRGIETGELAYGGGGGGAAEELIVAAMRKDSGISMGEADEFLADAVSMRSMMGEKGKENRMLWKKDECWDRHCACVRKTVGGVAR